VRILGRQDDVVVQVNSEIHGWPLVIEMLTSHMKQAKDFFRGEQIVLELGGQTVSQEELQSLIDVLSEQEVSLRMVRTVNPGVQEIAQSLGLAVTFQVQPRLSSPMESMALPAIDWEVLLSDQAQNGGVGSETASHEGEEPTTASATESAQAWDGAEADSPDQPRAQSAPSTGKADEAQPHTTDSTSERVDERGTIQRISAAPYFYRGNIRSGQIFRHAGHIVIVGDVNPGAQVISGGDVYVWGRLRGIVHAGAMGNNESVVGALEFEPVQLRIAGHIAMSPKGESNEPARWFWRRGNPGRPELARVINQRIVVDQWDDARWPGKKL
jgi:septum site-determining protein MinC